MVLSAVECECSINCKDGPKEGPMFFCVFCERARRWHDLLLPKYIHREQEVDSFRSAGYVLQYKQSVYIDAQHGYLIVPQVHYMIAIVRTLELRLEVQVKKQIEHVGKTGMGRNKIMAPLALDLFDNMPVFHHEYEHADMARLGGVALLLGLEVTQGIFENAQALLEKFITKPPESFPYQKHSQHARNNIHDWGATAMLEEMVSKLPRRLKTAGQLAKIQKIASRIWTKSSEHGRTSRSERLQDRARMLAYIVEHACKYGRGQIAYPDLLKLINLELHTLLDHIVESSLKRFIVGTDWSKKVGNARLPGGPGRKGMKI
jgi:hypothetical protein